jgi:hypothetical protein
MKPYYYVTMKPTNGLKDISILSRHNTLESAVKASEMYAEQRPTVTFEVLQCVAISSTPKPRATTFYLDKALNNIPTD